MKCSYHRENPAHFAKLVPINDIDDSVIYGQIIADCNGSDFVYNVR